MSPEAASPPQARSGAPSSSGATAGEPSPAGARSGGDAPPAGVRPLGVLTVVGLGTMMSALSGSSINLALPDLGRSLGISITATGWVVSAYLLASVVLLLLAGRVGDLVGHRTVYLIGFGLFTVASLGCGLAGGFGTLIAARVAQGVGASLVMATGPALLTTTFPGRHRGRALGMLSTATYTGLTLGPLLAGLVLAKLSWRWIFFLNVPPGVVVIGLGLFLLPPPERREIPGFDWPGTATLVVGLPLTLYALVEGRELGWGSPATLGAGGAGATLLIAFVWIEARSAAPLLDLGLFRSRVFSGATLSAFGNYIALFVPLILMPYFLKGALGLPNFRAGLVLSAQPLVMALVATPAGRLSDRIGSRWLATGGLGVMAVGLAGLARLNPSTAIGEVVAWLVVLGLGIGIFISPNSSALMGAAPRAQQGVAGGVMAIARSLGMVIGVATATTVFAAAGGQTETTWSATETDALHAALWVATGVCVAAAVAASLRGRG